MVHKANSRLRKFQWPEISVGRVSLSVMYVLVVMKVIVPCCLLVNKTIFSSVKLLCASQASTC
jgi:hypothetical protein